MLSENQFTADVLLAHFKKLSEEDQVSVIKFAIFLSSNATSELSKTAEITPDLILEKKQIDRPNDESVVKALRRLRETYPMLNFDSLMKVTADQMTEHVIKGQSAKATVDKLEAVFSEAYQKTLG